MYCWTWGREKEITLSPINNNIFEDVQECLGDPCSVDVERSLDVEDILPLIKLKTLFLN